MTIADHLRIKGVRIERVRTKGVRIERVRIKGVRIERVRIRRLLAAGAGASAALLCTLAGAATAGSLTIVKVGAPAVNCVFQPSCTITVSDTSDPADLGGAAGSGFLQSRTYSGAPGTPAAGKTGYEYRLDLTSQTANVDCIAGLVLNFGPVTKLPYAGSPADVFVVTSGGLGSIGPKSADQDGNVITFTFEKYVCPAESGVAGATTYFFGLAAAAAPHPILATLFGLGSPPIIPIKARAPNY